MQGVLVQRRRQPVRQQRGRVDGQRGRGGPAQPAGGAAQVGCVVRDQQDRDHREVGGERPEQRMPQVAMEAAALVADGADDVHGGERDVDDRRGGVRDVGWDLGRAQQLRCGCPGAAEAGQAQRDREEGDRHRPLRGCGASPGRPSRRGRGDVRGAHGVLTRVRRSDHARPRRPLVAPVTARANHWWTRHGGRLSHARGCRPPGVAPPRRGLPRPIQAPASAGARVDQCSTRVGPVPSGARTDAAWAEARERRQTTRSVPTRRSCPMNASPAASPPEPGHDASQQGRFRLSRRGFVGTASAATGATLLGGLTSGAASGLPAAAAWRAGRLRVRLHGPTPAGRVHPDLQEPLRAGQRHPAAHRHRR